MKFPITVLNKKITVEAPNKDALPDIIEELVKTPEFQAAPEIQPEVAQPGLPKLAETERRITERRKEPGGFEQARETLRQPLGVQDILTPGKRLIEAAIPAAGEVFRRGEAAIAGPLLELQKGKISTVPEAFVKGITGERRVELGDPIRATGFGGPLNEAIATTVGFGATLGATNLASKGKLIGAGRKASQALKESRAIKAEKRARFFTERGTRLRTAVKDILGGVKKEFDILYDKVKGIGGNKISSQETALADEFLSRVPKATISRFNRRIGTKRGIQLGEGVPVNNVSETKALKDIISDTVPQNVWDGVEKASQAEAIAIGDVAELRDIIANNAGGLKGKLIDLNDKFSRLSRFRTQISGITTKAKGVKKGTVLKGIRKEAQAGELEILTEFSKQFFPETGTILKEIDAFNRTELIAKFGRRVISPENILRAGIIGAVSKSRRGGGQGLESIPAP